MRPLCLLAVRRQECRTEVPSPVSDQGLSQTDLIRIQEYISHIRSRRMHTLSRSDLRGSPQGLESPGPLEEQLGAMNLRG